ncbi:hypothetical protein BJY52DRAFT_766424 [Lactarius psammicola]|nr:hypothetical protein BJY52DRAFT_766424 [Lactarius psammicola]
MDIWRAVTTYLTAVAVLGSARRRFFVGGPFSFSLLAVRIASALALLPSSTFFVRSLRLRGALFSCSTRARFIGGRTTSGKSSPPRGGATGDAADWCPRSSSSAPRFREFSGASLPAVASVAVAPPGCALAMGDLAMGFVCSSPSASSAATTVRFAFEAVRFSRAGGGRASFVPFLLPDFGRVSTGAIFSSFCANGRPE